MRRDDWATLRLAMMAALACLWLLWVMAPSFQPAVAFLVAVWLIVMGWLWMRG